MQREREREDGGNEMEVERSICLYVVAHWDQEYFYAQLSHLSSLKYSFSPSQKQHSKQSSSQSEKKKNEPRSILSFLVELWLAAKQNFKNRVEFLI